jgi:16S rRNA (guanine527-N7)-methyltransferase
MSGERLAEICAGNGLPLSADTIAKLEFFVALLIKKNEVINLISRKNEDNILEKHILHSLVLGMADITGFTIPQKAYIFDLGTGGGLPGIPIAIVRTDVSITLCDSIAKKIAAVEEMISALSLANTRAITARAETLEKDNEHRSRYDLVVSRAVAPLDDLVKWSHGLAKAGGSLLALKGGDISDEIKRTQRLRYIAEVIEYPLALIGYDGFTRDEKKVVRVRFGS